jgi:hypothetical protein
MMDTFMQVFAGICRYLQVFADVYNLNDTVEITRDLIPR